MLINPATTMCRGASLGWARSSAATEDLLDSEINPDDRGETMCLAGLGPLHGAVDPVSIGQCDHSMTVGCCTLGNALG